MQDGNSPLVSIVVPVYNGERFLEDALDAISNQTYSNWEAIIVDDCSTDSTPEIAQRFVDNDERFRYIRNAENKKLPASLNVGFRNATGSLHTWTSDDNMFRPEAISKMVDVLESNQNASLVYCNIQRIDEKGQPISFPKPPLSPSFLYIYNVVQACFLYRSAVTEKLSGYDESLFLVEDYDFWLRAKRHFDFHHIDETLYDYRMHDGALTTTKQKAIRDKANQILLRELHNTELSFPQRLSAGLGVVFNKVRTLGLKE